MSRKYTLLHMTVDGLTEPLYFDSLDKIVVSLIKNGHHKQSQFVVDNYEKIVDNYDKPIKLVNGNKFFGFYIHSN